MPALRGNLDPGERCDCDRGQKKMLGAIAADPAIDKTFRACMAELAGTQKAAQDAVTSTDGSNAANGHETQTQSTTAGFIRQSEV